MKITPVSLIADPKPEQGQIVSRTFKSDLREGEMVTRYGIIVKIDNELHVVNLSSGTLSNRTVDEWEYSREELHIKNEQDVLTEA